MGTPPPCACARQACDARVPRRRRRRKVGSFSFSWAPRVGLPQDSYISPSLRRHADAFLPRRVHVRPCPCTPTTTAHLVLHAFVAKLQPCFTKPPTTCSSSSSSPACTGRVGDDNREHGVNGHPHVHSDVDDACQHVHSDVDDACQHVHSDVDDAVPAYGALPDRIAQPAASPNRIAHRAGCPAKWGNRLEGRIAVRPVWRAPDATQWEKLQLVLWSGPPECSRAGM